MRLLAIILAVTGVPSAAGAINLDSSRFPAIRVRFDSEAQRPLAEAALGATEDAWQRQIVEWGLPVPWTGGDDGPVRPGVEVSIARTLAGAGGAMLDWLADVPSTPRCDCAVRVLLDDRQPDLAKVPETLFHEFNHAVVAGVDCTESPSVSEAFAVALQDAQFPGSTMVRGVVRQPLPGGHGSLNDQRQGRWAVCEAPEQAHERQHQHRHPSPLVPAVVLQALGRKRQVGHVQAQRKNGNQRHAQQPVQGDSHGVVTGDGRFKHGCSLGKRPGPRCQTA